MALASSGCWSPKTWRAASSISAARWAVSALSACCWCGRCSEESSSPSSPSPCAPSTLLGTFNLIPVPPLDGFGVLGLLVSEDLARRIQHLGRALGSFSIIGLLLVWQVFGGIFQPVFSFA